MKKTILFDFWGTLVENGVWSPIKQVRTILNINIPFPEYVVRMEKAMMTQKFDSLTTAFKEVCKEFGLDCNKEKLEQLVGMWNKSWMLASPYTEVLEELPKLKNEYRLVLISNTDCFSVQQVMDKFKLAPLFDHHYFSYDIHLIKTDKDFFKRVLTEVNATPEECIMVGDSIQSDILPAKRAGIKVILVDRKDCQDFQPKIKSFKELESVLK